MTMRLLRCSLFFNFLNELAYVQMWIQCMSPLLRTAGESNVIRQFGLPFG